jgi:hypothetical protein
MVTLKEYIKHLQEVLDKNPLYAEFPVIYAVDEEGNSYHKVYNTPTLVEVDDINDYYLDVNFSDSGEDSETPNAVIIN